MKDKNDLVTPPVLSSLFDRHKTFIEYYKFLTTLSTGSLVLLTSFMDKLISQPKCVVLIGISLTSFMVTILGSVLSYTIITIRFGMKISENGKESMLLSIGTSFAWAAFLIAIIALTVFALINL